MNKTRESIQLQYLKFLAQYSGGYLVGAVIGKIVGTIVGSYIVYKLFIEPFISAIH